METFVVKIEPELQDVKVHEYNIEFHGSEQEKKKEHKLLINNNIVRKVEYNTKNRKMKSPNSTIKAPFTFYLKKRFINTYMEKGCTSKTLQKEIEQYNVNEDEVKEYFARAAKEAQDFVHQECDSLCFSNITEWLKHLKAVGAHRDNNYESAIMMNAIVHNECQPQKHEVGGVNLKSIYRFISNGLMGLPQKPLDQVSAKFLSNEFQDLINEANTDDADNEVRVMKEKLETAISQRTEQQSSSLDPLKLADMGEILRTCEMERNYAIVKIEK